MTLSRRGFLIGSGAALLAGADDLARLEEATRRAGCELILIDHRARVEQMLELILAATEAQVSDPAFADELKSWIRFNARSAIETGDGARHPPRPPQPAGRGRRDPARAAGAARTRRPPARSRAALRLRAADASLATPPRQRCARVMTTA
ncbi:MAG: hypothetical protein MUC71_04265 [Steroidobacteraceae bacterium]|jgi:hypothetical protein|nr:hypothetical protein [Steroidobacteraceae bacterium]